MTFLSPDKDRFFLPSTSEYFKNNYYSPESSPPMISTFYQREKKLLALILSTLCVTKCDTSFKKASLLTCRSERRYRFEDI